MMAGVRAGVYRTQQFDGGVYTAYRTDYRDIVVGADGLWDHWPDSHFQVGFNIEHRVMAFQEGDDNATRGVVFNRYVFQYGDSLYLPPMHYVEAYLAYEDNFLPDLRTLEPAGERYEREGTAGLHYRIDYRTPYWDPEGGFSFDAVCENGIVELAKDHDVQKISGQLAFVKSAPDLVAALSRTSVAAAGAGLVRRHSVRLPRLRGGGAAEPRRVLLTRRQRVVPRLRLERTAR